MTNQITEVPVNTSGSSEVPPAITVEQIGQEVVSEQPAQEGTPVKTEEPQPKKPRGMSKAYASLKEREAIAAKREQELAEREQKLSEKAAAENLTYEDLKKTPRKVLDKLGISFEDLAQAVIKEGQEPGVEDVVTELKTKVETLEERLEREKEEAKEKEDKAVQDYIDRAVKDYRVRLGNYIQSQPEQYELIIAQDAVDLVFETIEAYYHKNNKICSMEEAAKATEDFLTERAKKLLGLKKLSVPKVEDKKPRSFGHTLTNGDASFSKPSTNGISSSLPKHERIKRAAAMLRFN